MPIEKSPKVAIVHDWLWGTRGGENVLDALCELFPQAEIFTLFHKKGSQSARIEARPIRASFLNRLPLVQRYYRHLLPILPFAIERLDVTRFDLVISSSHCVAKGIIPSSTARHICYCHTPMRYAWDQSQFYFGSGIKRWLIEPALHYLRLWDQASSARVDHFVANSHFVAQRIEKYYRRSASVVHPFVDLNRFKVTAGDRGDYYLVVSAFAPYKRVDLAIEACQRLGKRLIVVGQGQDEKRLRRVGGRTTEFVGALKNEAFADLYAGAKALLFPGVEDFGITPLEAMACGTPVLALGQGGALETVQDGVTGFFFPSPTVPALMDAILHFESQAGGISRAACRKRAEQFSRQKFQAEFLDLVHSDTQDLELKPRPLAHDQTL